MQTIQLTYKEGYAIAQLDRGKANPINLQMIRELIDLTAMMAEDSKVKGLILTGKEGYFTAGLDLMELSKLDHEGMKNFWKEFTHMMAALVSFPKPLIAAITGHSPAGGCILAICCDYRVMAEGKYMIGLNEVPVGIIVPKHIHSLYAFWIGERNAYQNLMEGKLMSPEEAHHIHLIDHVVPMSKVLEKAEEKMRHYIGFNEATWQTTKRHLRSELIKQLQVPSDAVFDATVANWFSPEVQGILSKIVSSLKK
ncbi:MAG: enoyl-CoA hydratase/isomerase family protein [Cytophagales bacterium]|nr:MAG: enoyl-CoA hydratase/isomerase family protein [Cytophagales bacterium]